MRVKWQTWVIFIITIVFCLQILSILYVKRNPVTPKLGTRITLEHYDKSKMYKPRSRNDPEHKLCLLVTYRDSLDPRSHGIGRKEQLELFQTEMKHVLGVRNISYTLIVSEQEDGLLFNKGMAFNFGFLMSYQRCDYYIFHDIDMYPQSLLNTYEYPKDGPMHLITSTQYWGGFYNADIAGGVLAMTQEQFIICNGYSNKYWGWGFEDNDIYYRIVNNGLQFYRHETETGYFKVLPHEHGDIGELLARDQTRLSQAYAEFSKRGLVDYSQDGLTTLNATLLEIIADQPDYFHFIHRVHNRDFLLQEDVFDPVQTMKDFYAELSQFYGPVDTSIVFVWNEK